MFALTPEALANQDVGEGSLVERFSSFMDHNAALVGSKPLKNSILDKVTNSLSENV